MTSQDPTFSGFVKASGQTNPTSVTWKRQSGGPSSDLQCAGLRTYSDGIRIANWNEDEYAISSMLKPTPLPSQFGHQYESTYKASYDKSKTPVKVPQLIKELPDAPLKTPGAFPSHQPVLDTPKLKAECASYLTSSMAYGCHFTKPAPAPAAE